MIDGFYLGVDIGTSSLKLLSYSNGVTEKAKAVYKKPFPEGIFCALTEALKEIDAKKVCALSVSSQVGTYVVDGKTTLFWSEKAGREELSFIKSKVRKEEFISEISMDHPELISYPLPRFLYIKNHFEKARKVCMSKDSLIEYLTGNYVSDNFTYRGIVNQTTNEYSQKLLDKFGLNFDLPEIKSCFAFVGKVKEDVAKELGINPEVKVYNGLNDFYAGLIGMGIYNVGDIFELSGTSEHLGVISDRLIDTKIVSGPYLNGFATYGGTASSGTSCAFAIDNFGIDGLSLKERLKGNPPLFLPYLNGERAPIFDENARGVFFGIDGKTTKKDMAYSVLEGVCFGLFDIYQSLNGNFSGKIISAGGSAKDLLMTEIKAELFEREIVNTVENDVSALGASIVAQVGAGKFKDVKDAIKSVVKYGKAVKPCGEYGEKLRKRFCVYKTLYKDLKKDFIDFKEIL